MYNSLYELDTSAVPTVTEPRLRFGSVADLYDRVRPGYPEGLIDAVLSYGCLYPGDRMLEVGAGTGQATMQFAERGLSVLAVDPSIEMTDIFNRKFMQAGLNARALVSDFESAELDDQAFDLICAATSWHWLDPASRFTIAARAIAPGGTLAVLWTWPRWRSTELVREFDAVYEASGAPLAEMGPMYPYEPDVDALAREWVRETSDSALFGQPEGKLCSWSATYTATGYTELLGTYGDHIALEPALRGALFDGLEVRINRAGGKIELPYSTLLLLARAQ